MGTNDDIRRKARSGYVYRRMMQSTIAAAHGVSEATVGRWKKAAKESRWRARPRRIPPWAPSEADRTRTAMGKDIPLVPENASTFATQVDLLYWFLVALTVFFVVLMQRLRQAREGGKPGAALN